MAHEFPEVTSFSTLLKYALALETAVGDLSAQAAGRDGCRPWAEGLGRCTRKHEKRAKQLERLRRERLNEVILQSVAGIDRDAYLPAGELPTDDAEAIAAVAAAEDRLAAFYSDAARMAASVLGGLDRSFAKLATECEALAAGLRGGT